MREIGPEEILKIRVENNLTLEQFGASVGVTGKTASLWERGLSKPRRTHAFVVLQRWPEVLDEKGAAGQRPGDRNSLAEC